MKRIFESLSIGDKFEIKGIRLIKISNDKTEGKELSRCIPNALNMDNNHRMVVGDKCKVDKLITV